MAISSRSFIGILVVALSITPNLTLAAKAKAATATSTEVSIRDRATAEIDRRIADLTALSTRIGTMDKLRAEEIKNLQEDLSKEIKDLTDLKTKIAAETDLAILKEEQRSITEHFRIFTVVMPRAQIAASADRVLTIVSEMKALQSKLDLRVAAATSTNAATYATANADFKAKVASAESAAKAALDLIRGLAPDKGNATVAAANKTAVSDARAKLKAAHADLVTAHADLKTILDGLKGVTRKNTKTVQ